MSCLSVLDSIGLNKKSLVEKSYMYCGMFADAIGTSCFKSKEDIEILARDIFDYYGRGCRSVSHLILPVGYDINRIFEGIIGMGDIINNKKYGNNYDYNKAIYLMSEYKFLDNGFFIVKEGKEMHSPISTINYEYYDNISLLREKINPYQTFFVETLD